MELLLRFTNSRSDEQVVCVVQQSVYVRSCGQSIAWSPKLREHNGGENEIAIQRHTMSNAINL